MPSILRYVALSVEFYDPLVHDPPVFKRARTTSLFSNQIDASALQCFKETANELHSAASDGHHKNL